MLFFKAGAVLRKLSFLAVNTERRLVSVNACNTVSGTLTKDRETYSGDSR